MPTVTRQLPALCAFFVLAIVLAACGDSVPGNSVASIDGKTIPRTEFNHWMTIAQAASRGVPPKQQVPYTPPAFAACVAKLRTTAPKPAPGQPKTTDATFKAQCKQEYEQLKTQVMQFLVSDIWIRGEASDQGVKFSDKELEAEYAKDVKQAFPKPADFQKYLANSGFTVTDVKRQISFSSLSTKLRAKVLKGIGKATNKDVVAYYAKHKKNYTVKETRDVRIVLTKTKAKAVQALAALKAGQSWKAVTKKFSIDPSKQNGGVVSGLPRGQYDPAVDKAIFSAEKGAFLGPIETQFGFYIVRLQKITPQVTKTVKQVTPQIKQQLENDNQTKALTKFSNDLKSKWKPRTNCRKDYATDDCDNGPKTATTATAAAGGQQPQPAQPPPAQPPPAQPSQP